jgi:proline dehydrogenase
MIRRAKQWVWSTWDWVASRAARAYIVGPHLDDALSMARRLAHSHCPTTLGYWNVEGESAAVVASEYFQALHAIARDQPDAYLSLKAPAIGLDRYWLNQIYDQAAKKQVRLHFDSLAIEHTDETQKLILEGVSRNVPMGCTLPGRWKRSLDDAEWAITHQLRVRVVKGQWPDPDLPDRDMRLGFLAVIGRLSGRAKHVAVATHDPTLAAEAIGILKQSGTPCDLELLYGLPADTAWNVARTRDVPVRFYLPYGRGWVPYCMSQIQKNPSILRWILQDLTWHSRGRLPQALASR